MGGKGSGNWYRWNRKEMVEDYKTLDVRSLHKEKLLHPGTFFTNRWCINNKSIGDISVHTSQNQLILSYRYRHSDEEKWETVEEPIKLTWTPCNYGGKRPWFICPGVVNGRYCGRRVAILYDAGKYFLCRHCYGLAYASQNETEFDRVCRKMRKIRGQLGVSMNLLEPVRNKPKGMHWKTFKRLRNELEKHKLSLYLHLAKRLVVSS